MDDLKIEDLTAKLRLAKLVYEKRIEAYIELERKYDNLQGEYQVEIDSLVTANAELTQRLKEQTT